jgi:hypothetical protein
MNNIKAIVQPLNLRDAFYGGRKNAYKLKFQTKYYGILMIVIYIQLSNILIIILQAIQRKFINHKNTIKAGMV